MTSQSLADYIADTAGRLEDVALTERDLERINYARRCLARVAKRVRTDLRGGAISADDCVRHVLREQGEAQARLAGTGWNATARLKGASRVDYMARRSVRPGVTIAVTATSLDGLLAGIDLVDDEALAAVRAA